MKQEEKTEETTVDDVCTEQELLESIWSELGGQVDRERICLAIRHASAKYAQARVQTFVPILVHRYALDELRMLDEDQVGDASD